MVGGLKFHYWNVVVVLALVFGERFVESQYYLEEDVEQPAPNPIYLVNSDVVAAAQPFFPLMEVEGRSFAGGGVGVVQIPQEGELPGRRFAARMKRSARDDSDEDEDDEEEDLRPRPSMKPKRPKVSTLPAGRARPVKLPPNFDDKVKKRMKMGRRKKVALHGDPDPIDEEDDDGRRPESRLLWPFSIEITKGKDKGWGGPGGYGSYPPPRTGLGFGLGVNGHKVGFDVKHDIPQKQYGRIGVHKGRYPNRERDDSHFHMSYGAHNGWGWDAFIEHEKHRLKYEILKLKAKKKIAVLQNKVELKKLFSMLLQKKIQALEWW